MDAGLGPNRPRNHLTVGILIDFGGVNLWAKNRDSVGQISAGKIEHPLVFVRTQILGLYGGSQIKFVFRTEFVQILLVTVSWQTASVTNRSD